MKSLTELINDWISEHGSAAITRDHLALWRDRAQLLEKENVELKDKHAELGALCRKLQGELLAKASADEFVEHRGAFFKRKETGGYHKAVYCPRCKQPMGSLHGVLNYSCERDKIMVDFVGGELDGVMAELPP